MGGHDILIRDENGDHVIDIRKLVRLEVTP